MKRFIKGAILATMFLGSYAAITEITHPTAYVAEASLLDALKGEAKKYNYAYSNLDWWYQPQGKCTFVKTTDGIMDVRGHHPKAKGKVVETGAILKLSNGKTGYVNKSTIPPHYREYLFPFSDASMFYIKCNNGKIYQYRNFEYGDVGLWYIDSYGDETPYGLEEGTFTRNSLSGSSSGGSSSSSGSKPKPSKPTISEHASGTYKYPKLVNVCGKFNKKKFKANKVYEMRSWETKDYGERKYVKLYVHKKYIGKINFKNIKVIEPKYSFSDSSYVLNNKKAITYKDKYFDCKKENASKYIGKQLKTEESYQVGRKTYHSFKVGNKWIGYMNEDDLIWIYSQYKIRKPILITKNCNTYKDLGKLTKKYSVKKGQAFIAKRFYDLFHKKNCYSIYDVDSNGKETWIGYIDENMIEGSEINKPKSVRITKKNTIIWKNLSLTQKAINANKYIGKTLTAKTNYDFGNGKIVYTIYDDKKFLGYVASSAVEFIDNEEEINEDITIIKNNDYSIWTDLSFNNKVQNINTNKVYRANKLITLNTGDKYYALSEKTPENEWKFMGYINSSYTNKVPHVKYKKYLSATLKDVNTPIWNDIYKFDKVGVVSAYAGQEVQLLDKYIFHNWQVYYSVYKVCHNIPLFLGYINEKDINIIA